MGRTGTRDGRQLAHGAARVAADDEDTDCWRRSPRRRPRRGASRRRGAPGDEAARQRREGSEDEPHARVVERGEVCLRAREPVTRAPELARRCCATGERAGCSALLRVAVALKGDARRVAVEIGEHGLGGEGAHRRLPDRPRGGYGGASGRTALDRDTRCDALTPPLRLRGAHTGAHACKTSHYGPVHANSHAFHRRARRELSTGPLRLW